MLPIRLGGKLMFSDEELKTIHRSLDDYVMDIIKQGGIYNTIRFDDDTAASINAGSWFPKESLCPDSDHYIKAYVVDSYGDISWENSPKS